MTNIKLPLSISEPKEKDTNITDTRLINLGKDLKLNLSSGNTITLSIKNFKIKKTNPIVLEIIAEIPISVRKKLSLKKNALDWIDYSLTQLDVNGTDYLSEYVCGE